MTESTIPSYKLFGENELWPSPDPVHCETIAARCSLHDWKIKPHRHADLMHILFLQRGHVELTIDTRTESLETPCIIFIPPRQIHGFCYSPDVQGFIVTLPHLLLNELLELSPQLRSDLNSFQLHTKNSETEVFSAIESHFEHFTEEYSGDRPGRASMLLAHLTQIVICLTRLGNSCPSPCDSPGHSQRINRFQDLIDSHFREWKSLGFYAERLGISTRQLNDYCRKIAGRSAQNMLHDRVVLEARRLLAYSELSVTGISYTLGFREPAYFTRFFTREQTVTPSSFRNSIRTKPLIQNIG